MPRRRSTASSRTPVYSHSGQQVLIPAGARLLGETKPVQALGETRLAVAFHRLLMPDGSTTTLDQFRGLNQIGDVGSARSGEPALLVDVRRRRGGGSGERARAVRGHRRIGRRRAGPHGGHRRQRRRRDSAGHRAGDEPVSESPADHHDSGGAPRQGLCDERSGPAGVDAAARRPAQLEGR